MQMPAFAPFGSWKVKNAAETEWNVLISVPTV